MLRPSRANIWRVVRWTAALALLAYVALLMDLAALEALIARLSAARIAALLVLGMVLQALMTARFHVAVRAWVAKVGPGERPLSRSALLGDHFVSTAYNTVLPSVIGGDVIRFLLARRFAQDDESGALTVVLLDRVLGLTTLAIVPVVAATWRISPFASPLPIVAFVGVLLGIDRIARAIVSIVSTRSVRVRAFVESVARALESVSSAERWRMIAWSVAYQIGAGLFFEIAAAAWDVGPGIHDAIWVGIPLASLFSIIPVSIGGMGLRESLYVEAARRSGVPPEVGLAMALCWGAVGLAYALVGIVVESRRVSVSDRRTT